MFDDKGNLKIGKICLSNDDFKEIFVSNLPNISHRENLFNNFKLFNSRFYCSSLTLWVQWLGGSFTTNKEFPNDIDVVNIINFDSLNENDISAHIVSNSLTRRFNSKQQFNVDSYIIVHCEEDEVEYGIYKGWIDYWTNLWSHDRNDNPRGFVEIDQGKEVKNEN